VQVHVTDRSRFPSFLTYLLLVHHARRQDPKRFAWREPPYEYEYTRNPFDVLAGSPTLREQIEAGIPSRDIARSWEGPVAEFARLREKFLLYT